MKRMRASVNQNDRITINIMKGKSIQYILVEAKTGKKTRLGEPIKFSLSVKKYFGTTGKTIKELYGFKSWRNRKLQTEIKRIWRVIDEQHQMKDENIKEQVMVTAFNVYDVERVA